MTIVKMDDLTLDDYSIESNLERRDSLKDSPWTDGTLDTLDKIITLHDVIVSRKKVCRNDAQLIEELSTENSILAYHTTRYPKAFYTEELSGTLYNETVLSLESSVVKSVSDTLTTITRFIGDHGRSAVGYIKEIFDEDTRTNASIVKVVNMVDYLDKTIAILDKSTVGKKLSRDIRGIKATIFENYTSKWNGLKDAIANPSRDFSTLSEAIAIPIIEIYPKTMEVLSQLMEGLSGAKTQEEVDRVLKGYKAPDIDIAKLNRWVAKHIPGNRMEKVEGVVTDLQVTAMSVRSHIKALENNRATRPSFKADDVLDSMSKTEWVTTKVVAEGILKKAESVAVNQEKLSAEITRLAKSTVVDANLGQQTLPVVLELLSIVRGFGALIDAIGILTVVKRELINEQLKSLVEGVSMTHKLIKDKSSEMTVGEVVEINKLISDLKNTL